MVADVRRSGMIMVLTENKEEAKRLKRWVSENAIDSKEFTACCNSKKCAFRINLKSDDNR